MNAQPAGDAVEEIQSIFAKAAKSAKSSFEQSELQSDGSHIDVFGYSWNSISIDAAVLASPTDAIVIQLALADEFVRCYAHVERVIRAGPRVIRRLTRTIGWLGRGSSNYRRVLSELGPTWVVSKGEGQDRTAIFLTCERVIMATEGVWAEDVLGVADVRRLIPDEYDDLIHLLVIGLENRNSTTSILSQVHERLRAIYFDEEPGSAADIALADTAKGLVARMFR